MSERAKDNRTCLLAFSLANLAAIQAWISIIEAESGGSEYFLNARPKFVLELATLVTIAGVWLLLWVALGLLERSTAGRGWIRGVLIVVCALSGAVRIIRYVVVELARKVADPKATELSGGMAVLMIFCMLVPVVFALAYPRKAIAIAERSPVFVVPLVIANIATAGWHTAKLGFRTEFAGQHATRQLRMPAKTRLVWVVFDEMDGGLTFEHRPSFVKMPQFDRLRASSLVATNAVPMADDTVIALPSLTTGRKVVRVYPTGTADLALQFAGSSGTRSWTETPTVFSIAKSLGRSTAIVGWYHPYCRLFGDLAAGCDAFGIEIPHLRLRTEAEDRGLLPYLVQNWMYPFVPETILHPEAWNARKSRGPQGPDVDINKKLCARAVAVAADPSFDFVFLHLAIPHPPGKAGSNVPLGSRSSYIVNYPLADAILEEMQANMVKAGSWNSNALIVTSDHSLRSIWYDYPFWTDLDTRAAAQSRLETVPLLIHMPGQMDRADITERLDCGMLFDVATGILRGDFTDAQTVGRWMRDRAKRQ